MRSVARVRSEQGPLLRSRTTDAFCSAYIARQCGPRIAHRAARTSSTGACAMDRDETNEVQRLNVAIQGAMRAVQTRGGTNGEGWSGGSQSYSGEGKLTGFRGRVRVNVGERLTRRPGERLREGIKDRVRELVRDRLANDLRATMLEAQSERGFDFSRFERRLHERLADT